MAYTAILMKTFNSEYIVSHCILFAWYNTVCCHHCNYYFRSGTRVHSLLAQAHQRIDKALRPRTSAAYLSKFKAFVAFSLHFSSPLSHLSSLLAFLELLAQNGSKAHTLSSYVSSISHFFKLYDIPSSHLTHRKVLLLIKSVSINSPYSPSYKAILTIPTLSSLILACDSLSYAPVYKAAFLLAFFTFLRLSNIAPSSSSSFDPSRHILRSDIVFGPPGAHIIIKWAKVMQASNKVHVVQIPSLPSSPLCPVKAIKNLLAFVPASKHYPLFLIPKASGLSILTPSMLSSTLSRLLQSLKLDPSAYGFHCFRRSRVSWAADHNVSLEKLKAHGGWASSAIQVYLKTLQKPQHQ